MNTSQYVNQHKERFIEELIELLKIPSISADKAYKDDVIKTSIAVQTALKRAGCDHVEICDTPGYPIVYGEKTIDPTCRPSSFTGTMTYNHPILWIYGTHHLLSR